jgi:flagellar motor switch protein FliG
VLVNQTPPVWRGFWLHHHQTRHHHRAMDLSKMTTEALLRILADVEREELALLLRERLEAGREYYYSMRWRD